MTFGNIRRGWIVVAVGWLLPAARAGADYERDVKPLLKARCYACHGALKQAAGLRLDTGRAMRRGGTSGAAVVAGQPDASRLLQRVSATDADERMPPEGDSLSAAQVDLLRAWVRDGAKSPESERPEPDPREHWAFRPPQRAQVPALGAASDGNAIDAFVEAELARHGLTSRPAASKSVLLRRVTLDLLGLPPTPAELQAFLADDSPEAYERVVDRLLADARHGERWGRHWMDVWRYSDWYGRRDANDVRNSASQIFRWRDWIVRSLNAGKGYDRMVQEMLAADEICPEDYDAGVATGYLIRNYYSLNPNDWMRSAVEHTGKAFLGLTFHCAHCHDHKYDPIAQDDYFRLRAFFEPLFIRQDRLPGEPDPGTFQDYTYAGSRSVQRLGAVRVFDRRPDAPTWFYTGGDERNRVKDRGSIPPGVPAFLLPAAWKIEPVSLPARAWYPGLRPEIQETLLADARRAVDSFTAQPQAPANVASGSGANDRVAEAKLAAARAELASLEARIAAERARHGELSGDVAELSRAASRAERDAKRLRAESELTAAEVSLADAEAKPADDAKRPAAIDAAKKAVATAKSALDTARAALAEEKLAETYSPLSAQFPRDSTGRRRALAQWITGTENPLTARVAVNHVWMRHFRSPLVASLYDFGRNGATPTHPELLDWLAVEFRESGWDLKRLHRLIVTSAAYRRESSGRDAPRNVAADPENKLLWRMNSWRMEAEAVRDSLLYLAGRLDLTQGGVETENKDALTTHRRTLYYSSYPEAGGKSAFGELFDAPDPLDCYRRVSSIVPQQALALTNSDLVHQTSLAIASEAPASADTDRFIEDQFAHILARSPTEAERRVCREALERQRQLAPQPESAAATARARESFVRVLLNHNDFVTVR